MKRVAFVALGLLLFASGMLAGRFSVREPARDERTEFERLEDRCLTDWAKVLAWATARGTALDFDPQSCRALKALYPKRPMMIAALAALLLLLVICDSGWREGAVKTSALSPFLAFTQEHAHCQGGREYGTTDDGLRWAACPCGGYVEARLATPAYWPDEVPWTWPNRLLFNLGRWYVRLEMALGRWCALVERAVNLSRAKKASK
jgi:hypothetical protein